MLRLLASLLLFAGCAPSTDQPAAGDGTGTAGDEHAAGPDVVRVALFNIWELSTAKITEADADGIGANPQARAAATIIQRIRPDVLVINEIDHDYDAVDAGLELNARRFADLYLASGKAPIEFPFAWAAPNNTGILSGLDLDGDGHVATGADRGERSHGNDSWGYGVYPGQYSMAVLSRYPVLGDQARTFARFLWRDLPGHHLPQDFYSDDVVAALRLSSKSHQDVPVQIGGMRLHLWLAHPTPPVFDGEEDRNGRRNFDEIKLWIDYLDDNPALVDDDGRRGGHDGGDPFVIIGDLNASPTADGERYDDMLAIEQLLADPRILDSGPWTTSAGAPGLDAGAAAGPTTTDGHPERATTAFRGRGNRIDYVLPAAGLEIIDGGVFWPAARTDPEGAALAEEASDHRLVWIDLRWPPERR